MTRWFPLLVVAAAMVPSVRAAERPLLLSLAGFPAPTPGASWADPGGHSDPVSRWSLFEGGRPAGRGDQGLYDVVPPRERGKAAGDARARAEARFAHASRTLAATRAGQGDRRGAIKLLTFASELCDDEQVRAEIQQSLAIYRNELQRVLQHPHIWATIDGLPPGYRR